MAKRRKMSDWARLGAERRLEQLDEERAAIYREFPELRRGRPSRRIVPAVNQTASRPARSRRRKLSPEARKRISEVQKARWAKWRKSKEKK